MIIFNFLLASLISVTGFSPAFQPPSCGIGAETAGGGVRSFSMGGVSAGLADSNMVSGANPAASAWAASTGLAWGTKVRDTNDLTWSGASSFPEVSMVFPLPLNLQFSALMSSRSRINIEDTVTFIGGSGTEKWTGSSGESYLGFTSRVSEHLAFSLGGKCFFGSAMGNAVTLPDSPDQGIPLASSFRDDLSFSPSWGPALGAFLNTRYFSAGMSIVTDRSGNLDIHRDYLDKSSADTTVKYSVPGEFSAGVSSQLHPRIIVGLDYFARKSFTILDQTTDEGSYLASGIEFNPGYGLRLRGGFRTMNGLWRDGASRYSGGIGYFIAGGRASFDIGASYETWGVDESETVVFASIRTSENWLGQ